MDCGFSGATDPATRNIPATDASGADDRRSHLTWIKILWEVGELMDHHIRAHHAAYIAVSNA
jgi:hypothetical protein